MCAISDLDEEVYYIGNLPTWFPNVDSDVYYSGSSSFATSCLVVSLLVGGFGMLINSPAITIGGGAILLLSIFGLISRSADHSRLEEREQKIHDEIMTHFNQIKALGDLII